VVRPAGRAYHLPVGPPCSQQELADAFARAAGRDRARLSALPAPVHRLLALGHPLLRELLGTRHQFAAPFVVDDSRFRREVGPFTTTPLDEAAAATVAWFRGRTPAGSPS
jgi:nucleoside-diphosphate-sugar epimerase